jgi:hypothetical protein
LIASCIPLLALLILYPAECEFLGVNTIVPEAAPGAHVPPVTITGSGVPCKLMYA